MNRTNEALIPFVGQIAKVNCDRNCAKAWGRNNRPKIQLSADEDDWAYLADSEVVEAPDNPGTYEGEHGKPSSPDQFPNKWCVRECERCNISEPGKSGDPLPILSFDGRVYNYRSRDEMEKAPAETAFIAAQVGAVRRDVDAPWYLGPLVIDDKWYDGGLRIEFRGRLRMTQAQLLRLLDVLKNVEIL